MRLLGKSTFLVSSKVAYELFLMTHTSRALGEAEAGEWLSSRAGKDT